MLANVVREAQRAQSFVRRHLGRGCRGQRTGVAQPLGGRPNVAWFAKASSQCVWERTRVAQRMSDRAHPPVPPDVRTRQEGT